MINLNPPHLRNLSVAELIHEAEQYLAALDVGTTLNGEQVLRCASTPLIRALIAALNISEDEQLEEYDTW